jgi:hypothetical protein
MDTRTVKHALSDPELMITQVILRLKLRGPAPPSSRNAAISLHVEVYHGNRPEKELF